MQNCSERKDMDSYFKKELDSLKAQVENLTQLANARRDTIIENYRYITKIVNEAEILKEEIRLTEIMDSVVGNYKKHHPGTAEIKVTSDSTAEISKREMKFVTEQFVDLKILKEVNAKDIEQFGLYERALADKDEIIGIQEQEITIEGSSVNYLCPRGMRNSISI
jgi:hypothetical protein